MVNILGLIESYPYVFLILFLIVAGFISHRIAKKRKEKHRINNYLKSSGFLDVKKEVAISKRISSVKPKTRELKRGRGFFGSLKKAINSFKEGLKTKKRLKRLSDSERQKRKITVKKLLKEKEGKEKVPFKEKLKRLFQIKIKKKPEKEIKIERGVLEHFMDRDTNFALLTLIIIIAVSLVGATIFYQFMLGEINTKYGEKEAELNSTVQLLNQKKQLLKETQDRLELINKREEQITGQYTQVKEDFDSCEDERDSLKTEKESLEAEVSLLQNQISGLEAGIILKDNRIGNLEEGREQAENERDSCRSELSTCQSDLASCREGS